MHRLYNLINMLMKKNSIVIFLILIASWQLNAQSRFNRYLNLSIGEGITEALYGCEGEQEETIRGSGLYLQGEYVFEFNKWIDLRPYTGFLYARTDQGDDVYLDYGYEANATTLLIGGKARLTFPIPWVAPYIESGLGFSLGYFETYTYYWDVNTVGIFSHVPLAFGVKIGRKHNIEIGTLCYILTGVEQLFGATTIGLKIPIQ